MPVDTIVKDPERIIKLEEVDYVLEKLPQIICSLRKISPLNEGNVNDFPDDGEHDQMRKKVH